MGAGAYFGTFAGCYAGVGAAAGAPRGMSRPGASLLRDSLVVAEVTATFVLAVGAGLLLHTMANLLTRNLGFETRQLLVAEADAPAHSEQDAQSVVRQYD